MFRHVKKTKVNWRNLVRIVEALTYYLLLAHFIACMWIELTRIEGDDRLEKSWLRRAPSPRKMGTRGPDDIDLSNDTIYIHGIYWSIVTFSHIGLGDISAVTVPERAFNCCVILIYTFAYAILFGNMASLVSKLGSSLHTTLYKNYYYIMVFLQKKSLS
jgi:hypothetical protein